jgi:hypothetical protein
MGLMAHPPCEEGLETEARKREARKRELYGE